MVHVSVMCLLLEDELLRSTEIAGKFLIFWAVTHSGSGG
jgi:hypothetical protein